ncbi:S41 family peptidase [soil metagenome]
MKTLRSGLVPATATLAAVLCLAGCGGGGSGGGGTGTSPTTSTNTSSTLPADVTNPGSSELTDTPVDRATLTGPSRYVALCAAPRTGIDPSTSAAYVDQQGTLTDEKNWVRSWIDQTYLWFDEVPATLIATNYATPKAFFDVLKTPAVTASGQLKDRFHFTSDTARYQASSQSIESGYGIEFAFIARTRPRNLRIAYTEPGSPAAAAGIARGAAVLEIDGVDVVNGNTQAQVDTLNAGLVPTANGQVHSFRLRAIDGTESTVSLTSASVSRTPVQNVRSIDTSNGRVGYLQFNDHVDKAEAQLIAAVNKFKTDGVTDLVLDMRYNGGGKLAIASQLAYMIAPVASTQNKTFERIRSNSKNPFGFSASQANLPFYTRTRGYSTTSGQPLPQLGLSRVTVLAGPDTCSASESVVNSLRGVDIEVNLIGGTTCGKPYGFYPADNCGTTYFAIQVQGVNNKGFGDYGDGFAPTCTVADDFDHGLGDPAEARLAAALTYRSTGSCPVPVAARSARAAIAVTAPAVESAYLDLPVTRSNRVLEAIDLAP